MKCKRFLATLVLGVVVSVSGAFAQDYWLGGTGLWQSGNWSRGLPSAGDDVLIATGSDAVYLTGQAYVHSVALGGFGSEWLGDFIGQPASLTITNQLYIGYSANLGLSGGSSVTAWGAVSAYGGIDLENGSSLSGGYIYNNGTISTGLSGGGNAISAGGLDNYGYVSLQGAGDVVSVGSINNYDQPIELGNGATLNVSGDLVNSYGQVTTGYYSGGGNTINIGGTFWNYGFAYFGGAGDVITVRDFENQVEIDLENGAVLNVAGNLDNYGSIYEYSSTAVVYGNLNNYGSIILDPSTLIVKGTLINEPGSILSLMPGDVLQVANIVNKGAFTIPGGATIQAAYFLSSAQTTLNPQATLSVGTRTAGNTGYYQLANGTLGEHIDMNGFGVIVVNGPVHTDGTLDVQLGAGFTPKVGSAYEFITFAPGSYDGSVFASIVNDIFNNGTEKWVVVYNDAGGYVELLAANNSTVPEPSTFLLLGTSLVGLSYGMRRQLSRGAPE